MATRDAIPSGFIVSEPVWDIEKLIPVRALWEIAAMAGNVGPNIQNVNQQKTAVPAWKMGYNEILRRMVDALSPKDERNAERIYYDHSLPFNASIAGNRKLHRQMRVNVASACKFLEKRYDVSVLPAGLNGLRIHLSSHVALSNPLPIPQPVSIAVQSNLSSPKDNTKAIETKRSDLLSIVLAAMVDEAWRYSVDSDESTILLKDIQDLLASRKLLHFFGMRADVVVNAIEKGKQLIRQKKADLAKS